jgi:hypothetical protein
MRDFKHVLVSKDTHAKLKEEAANKGMLMYALVEQKFQNSNEVKQY